MIDKNIILVGMSGQMMNIPAEADTVLFAPFIGNFGGRAIADVIFGKFNVGGKLPFTFYADVDRLPPIEDYDMTRFPGRTYRYHRLEPEFPFGFGLSYSTFRFANVKVSEEAIAPCGQVKVSVEVTNEGPSGAEWEVRG